MMPLEARLILGLSRGEYARALNSGRLSLSARTIDINRSGLKFSCFYDLLKFHIARRLSPGDGTSGAQILASLLVEKFAEEVEGSDQPLEFRTAERIFKQVLEACEVSSGFSDNLFFERARTVLSGKYDIDQINILQ